MILFYSPVSTQIRPTGISRPNIRWPESPCGSASLHLPHDRWCLPWLPSISVNYISLVGGSWSSIHNMHSKQNKTKPMKQKIPKLITFSTNTMQRRFKSEMKEAVRRTGMCYNKMTKVCYIVSQFITLEIVWFFDYYPFFSFFFPFSFSVSTIFRPCILPSLTLEIQRLHKKRGRC